MRLRLPLVVAALLTTRHAAAQARTYQLASPDGRTTIDVAVDARLTYAVTHAGRALLAPSRISLALSDGRTLGQSPHVRDVRRRSADTTLHPVVAVKNAAVRDHFNELRLEMDGEYALELRAYDDGIAYRWTTALRDTIAVRAEDATFRFAAPATLVAGVVPSFMTHYEPTYRRMPLTGIRGDSLGTLPMLVDVGGGAPNGPKVAITESSLESYAGMYLVPSDSLTLVGRFPQAAARDSARNDRDVLVTARAPYLARTAGRRTFPWRIVMIADDDAALLANEMVYRLAPAQRLTDIAWIRPGKVSWDWWNALNVRDVSFASGVNTDTYKYYIDFAAKYHLPYVILDEGWYKLGDLLKPQPEVDVPALVQYGNAKGVGIILWAIWHTLDMQMTPALDQFERWGVKGIKVDFMQRDDQAVVDFYWRTAREAAARHLLVDFHGAHKPAGLSRAYPNVLSYEGVHGLENDKWARDVTPTHDVTLPFTRMLAGPMDYTPGAMRNAHARQFSPVFDRPMSQGTRTHQLAMYVVYESPLQMLADSPSEYLREPDAMAWLEQVPTTWDETHAIAGRVGQYVLIARRSGDTWYVGGMTDSTARTLPLDLAFLGDGRWTLEAWEDGTNAARDAMDARRVRHFVTRSDRIDVAMAPGGGWAAIIRRVP